MPYTWSAGDKLLAERLNQSDPETDARLSPVEHNIFELYLENYFSGKQTPFQGLFFDGFSDSAKVGVLSDLEIQTTNKKLVFPYSIPRFVYNFNSLTDGELNGQGGWTKQSGNLVFNVEGSVVYEGAKAISFVDSVNTAYYYHALDSSGGTGSVWGYFQGNASMDKNTSSVAFILRKTNAVGGNVADVAIIYYTATSDFSIKQMWGTNTFFTGVSKGAWHKIQIDWDTSLGTNGQFRVILDNGTPSAWVECYSNVKNATDVNTVLLYGDGSAGGAGTRYWDAFGYTVPVTSGSETSIKTTFQQAKKSLKLWVTRNFLARFNLASAIAQSATTLTIAGDQTGKFANGDTIDIYDANNFVRERKVLNAVPSFGGGITTLTFTPAIINASGFGTTAFIERVDVKPQVSLVDFGTADSFADLIYVKSIVDSVNSEVEDEYSYTQGTAQEDFKAKLILTRVDTSLTVYAKRLGVSLTDT